MPRTSAFLSVWESYSSSADLPHKINYHATLRTLTERMDPECATAHQSHQGNMLSLQGKFQDSLIKMNEIGVGEVAWFYR